MNWNKVASAQMGRKLYVIQAALEYFIQILVSGSFLATLTRELGLSDGLTGILSSIISLGCLFQLMSVFFRRRRVKGFVLAMSVVNQLLFLLLYIIPLIFQKSRGASITALAAIVLAYGFFDVAHPKKTSWLMSLVDNGSRGSFTAAKEIVSLLSGMVFTFLMSAVVDYYSGIGQMRIALILTAVVMAVISVLHTLVMVRIPEPVKEESGTVLKLGQGVKDILSNRKLRLVMVLFSLYYVAVYTSKPFYGTYMIGELSFSLTFISMLQIAESAARILLSRKLGLYADRHSFARMLMICFGVLIGSRIAAALATPATGRIMFVIYHICQGIAMAGINSALTNLIFDYVAPERRADSLAICQATMGTVGFVATLAVSPLIAATQGRGSQIFGATVYAQQILSVFSAIVLGVGMIFLRKKLIQPEKSAD